MKKFILVLLLWVGTACAQDGSCPCGELQGKHIRQDVKNRSIPESLSVSREITPAEMIGEWGVPSQTYSRRPEGKYQREDTLFKLTGYLRLFKLSPDDCDYHLEIAVSARADAPRIVAENPNTKEYCGLRQAFLNDLQEIYGMESKTKNEFKRAEETPVVTIVGYPFWDTAHWSKIHIEDRKGFGHGSKKVATLWEFHPVVWIQVE